MTNKTRKTAKRDRKTAENAPAVTVADVPVAETIDVPGIANKRTESLLAKRDAIKTEIATGGDPDAVRKLRLAVCNAESRAARTGKIAAMSDADAVTFAMFVAMHPTEAAINAFFARAIYVQDKLRAIFSALGRSVGLSAVTRNNSTRTVLRELATGPADRKTLLAAIVGNCGMTANTASSQVSSSLIALIHVGAVTVDPATKLYSIADAATADALAA